MGAVAEPAAEKSPTGWMKTQDPWSLEFGASPGHFHLAPLPALCYSAAVIYSGQQFASSFAGWYYFTSAADWCLRLH